MRARRAPHAKSKNGCLTCKVRRVKCDETRPHCRKCTETGRKCEGPNSLDLRFHFVNNLSGSRSKSAVSKIKVLSPAFSILQPQHSEIERRSFDYFLHRAAPCFAGAIEDDFWLHAIPSLALADSAVWDIAVSSSYMFEHVPHETLLVSFTSSATPPATGAPHRQALKWYNRGLSDLQKRMERNEMDSSYALLTCILCTAVEFQQNNVGNAMDLIQSGFRVLSQTLRSKKSTTSTQMGFLSEVIMSFFTRHALVVANFVMLPLSDWSDDLAAIHYAGPCTSTQSIQAHRIRSQLYHLMYQAYQTVRVAVLMWQDPEIIRGLLLAQRVTLDELIRWRVLFTGYCSSHRETMNEENMQLLASQLLMCWDVCYIWLEACTEISETSYDKHIDHFAEIITQSESVLAIVAQRPVEEQPQTKVVVDLAPPLYFTVMKCRDPVLRRKALALLEKAPPEGLWADVLTAQVVQNAISLEEGRPYKPTDLTDPESLAVLRTCAMPPEHRRIQTIAFIGQEKTHTGYTLSLQVGRVTIDASGKKRTVHENIRVENSTGLIAC